jgi:hypothetical protein
MLLMSQRGEVFRIVVIRITFLLNTYQYTVVQINVQGVSTVKRVMVAVTESQVIPDIMLATRTANDVVNLQPAATIRLGPPADRATAMLGYPFQQGGAFSSVQRRPPLLGEERIGSDPLAGLASLR